MYIDENIEKVPEPRARELMAAMPKPTVTNAGVCRVPISRWKTAQIYEKKTWMERNPGATEDRNRKHMASFYDYIILKQRHFQSMLEIGCGPFTNMQCLIPQLTKKPSSITLQDPLIEVYKQHQHCTYKNGTLHGVPVTCISGPAEELPTTQTYDLGICINVLPHVYDASEIMMRLHTVISGVLIFHEQVWAQKAIQDEINTNYDAGHPIYIAKEFLDSYLNDFYEPLFKTTKFNAELNRWDIYFIGEKR